MKAQMRYLYVLLCVAMLLFFRFETVNAITQQSVQSGDAIIDENTVDKTHSPYFVVITDNLVTDRLPLKMTSAKVNISGVIADVEITQQYINTGKTTLEAIYVFPMSTKAAVYAMEMQIGKRRLKAQIREKKQARKDYEKAKDEGRRVSLLEQDRPNVFSMRVANISPGDTINLQLKYTELLVPEKGEYSFVFPTVVGPRYTGGADSPKEEYTAMPYTHKNIDPAFRFNFELNLNAGMPVQEVICRTHKFITQYPSTNKVSMKLDPVESKSSNRDIIINYSLQGNQIQSGILLYKKGNEQHFLMMIQPPDRIENEAIPAREYIFVLDVSGSMNGFPLEISKTLMRNLIVNLKPTDQFNLVLFAGAAALFNPVSVKANSENINSAIRFINSKQGSGGTELHQALVKAYAIPQSANSVSRSVILLSDGYINAERKSLDLVNQNLGKANFFSFGIGTSVNRYLMEGLAFMGKGEAIIVDKKEQAGAAAAKFRTYIQTPVLSSIRLDFGDWQVYDVEPERIPDLMAERPLIIHGKYRGFAFGSVKLSGKTGKADFQQTIALTPLKPELSNKALPLLWAKQRIQQLEYYNSGEFSTWQSEKTIENEITRLGLHYSLITSHTSFIAIDEQISVDKKTQKVVVKQAVSLPQDVSELAVGEVIEILNVVEDDVHSDKTVIIQHSSSDNAMDEELNCVFVVVESMPQFPGGESALHAFLSQNLKYPEKAMKEKISGRVILQFTVDKNGDISDIVVVRGVSPELDAEAIRVIKSMPRWIPGKQRGKTVAVKYTLPINFKWNN